MPPLSSVQNAIPGVGLATTQQFVLTQKAADLGWSSLPDGADSAKSGEPIAIHILVPRLSSAISKSHENSHPRTG